TMRRAFVTGIATMIAVSGIAVLGHAQGMKEGSMTMSHGKPLVVTGTLIDTKCYSMDHRNKGVDHITPHGEMKGCATLCCNLGIPVAVLTSKGEVWTLITPTKDLADHMGQAARVTGARVNGHELRPDKIEVKDASGKWSEVKISMPMPM